jgi:predicted transposase/invertase (TIGR01784 family)
MTIPKDKKDVQKKVARKRSEKSEYINLLTDFGFKHIFGQQDIMINFLNSILPDIEGGIVTLSYEDPGKLPPGPKMRKVFFDLHCVTGKGERIIIEIQQNSQEFYTDRVLYYLSFAILEQAKKGKENGKTWNFELSPLYSVNIVNFRMKKDNNSEKYISYVQLFDRETKELFTKNPTLVFLELPNLPQKVEDLSTDKEKWGFVIRNLYKMNSLPDCFRSTIFEKVFQMGKIAALSDKQRKSYYRSLKFYIDMNVLIEEKDRQIQMYKQREAVLQKKEVAYQQEIADLHRILKLQGIDINLLDFSKLDKNIN